VVKLTVVMVGLSVNMQSTSRSIIDPDVRVNVNKTLELVTCQKEARDCFGGVHLTCAGLDTLIDVSEYSIFADWTTPDVKSIMHVAGVLLVEVGAHISMARILTDRIISTAVVFTTVPITPQAPKTLSTVIWVAAISAVARKRYLCRKTMFDLICGM
jgi:hypothetical protein